MGSHVGHTHSHVGGKTLQILPIAERLTDEQRKARAAKIIARRTVAERLSIAVAQSQFFAIRTHNRSVLHDRVLGGVILVLIVAVVYLFVR